MAFFSRARRPIGQILVDSGFVAKLDLERALEEQKHTNELLGQVLVRLGVLEKMDLDAALSIQGHLGKLEDAVRSAAGIRQMLGSLLLMSGKITDEQLDFALAEQKATNERLGDILVRLGLLSERQIGSVLEFQRNQERAQEGKSPLRLGEILVSVGTITRGQLDDALRKQVLSQKKLGEILVEEGYAEQQHVDRAIRIQQKLVQASLVTVISLAGCGGGGGGAGVAVGSAVVAAGVGITVTATLIGGVHVTGINRTLPAHEAVEVNVSSTVTVFFNNEMDESSINSTTFKVTGPDGAISGTVTYDRSSNTAVFTPIAPLMPQAEYTATVAKETREKSGTALSDNASWKFRTGKDELIRSMTEKVTESLFSLNVINLEWGASWPTVPFKSWRNFHSAWVKLEARQGEWDFTLLDGDVVKAGQKGAELMLVLSSTPLWASARANDGAKAEATRIEDWENYIRKVATRYKGQVHYYELWNEPDQKNSYTGTVDKLVELSRSAYQVLKEVDPTITVVSPAMTSSNMTFLDDYLAAGGGAFADIIAYHFYVTPKAPEAMLDKITNVRAVLAKHGISKPLWNTETGWKILNSDKNLKDEAWAGAAISNSDASAYIARSHILSWAAGVDRFYWYAWGHQSMGFTEYDLKTPKACATAFDEVQKWLVNGKLESCGKNGEGTWVVRVNRDGTLKSWIIWNSDKATSVQIPKEWNAKTMKDLTGNATNISNTNLIPIGSMPILIGN
jgi:hypothetical protein